MNWYLKEIMKRLLQLIETKMKLFSWKPYPFPLQADMEKSLLRSGFCLQGIDVQSQGQNTVKAFSSAKGLFL